MKIKLFVGILVVICFIMWIGCLNLDINWGDAIVTLLAAFLGAWFAYLFNLQQQKKWDKERKKEEKEGKIAEEVLQLNYLQTYLYALIDELYQHYQVLSCKRDLYANIIANDYQLKDVDLDSVSLVFIDFSSKFRSNWDALYFTSNEPDFMYSLGLAETSWHKFVSCHTFEVKYFERKINLFREDLNAAKKEDDKKLIIKQFIDTEKNNYDSEIFRLQEAVACINNMISVLNKYFKEYYPNNSLKKIICNKTKDKFIKKCVNEVPKTRFKYNIKKYRN